MGCWLWTQGWPEGPAPRPVPVATLIHIQLYMPIHLYP